MPVAYGVRKDYQGVWLPGVIAVGDGEANLAELLEQGDGEIVVADEQSMLVVALDEQLALKRVPARSAEDKARASAVKAARTEFNKLNLEGLQKAAKDAGVDVPASATKRDHVEALVSHVEATWTPERVEA